MKSYFVYILTNHSGTLYVGVTNDLRRRVWKHKQEIVDDFTTRYRISRLVYYEETTDVTSAISREKQIKGWLRERKVDLIESTNPEWRDLSRDWED